MSSSDSSSSSLDIWFERQARARVKQSPVRRLMRISTRRNIAALFVLLIITVVVLYSYCAGNSQCYSFPLLAWALPKSHSYEPELAEEHHHEVISNQNGVVQEHSKMVYFEAKKKTQTDKHPNPPSTLKPPIAEFIAIPLNKSMFAEIMRKKHLLEHNLTHGDLSVGKDSVDKSDSDQHIQEIEDTESDKELLREERVDKTVDGYAEDEEIPGDHPKNITTKRINKEKDDKELVRKERVDLEGDPHDEDENIKDEVNNGKEGGETTKMEEEKTGLEMKNMDDKHDDDKKVEDQYSSLNSDSEKEITRKKDLGDEEVEIGNQHYSVQNMEDSSDSETDNSYEPENEDTNDKSHEQNHEDETIEPGDDKNEGLHNQVVSKESKDKLEDEAKMVSEEQGHENANKNEVDSQKPEDDHKDVGKSESHELGNKDGEGSLDIKDKGVMSDGVEDTPETSDTGKESESEGHIAGIPGKVEKQEVTDELKDNGEEKVITKELGDVESKVLDNYEEKEDNHEGHVSEGNTGKQNEKVDSDELENVGGREGNDENFSSLATTGDREIVHKTKTNNHEDETVEPGDAEDDVEDGGLYANTNKGGIAELTVDKKNVVEQQALENEVITGQGEGNKYKSEEPEDKENQGLENHRDIKSFESENKNIFKNHEDETIEPEDYEKEGRIDENHRDDKAGISEEDNIVYEDSKKVETDKQKVKDMTEDDKNTTQVSFKGRKMKNTETDSSKGDMEIVVESSISEGDAALDNPKIVEADKQKAEKSQTVMNPITDIPIQKNNVSIIDDKQSLVQNQPAETSVQEINVMKHFYQGIVNSRPLDDGVDLFERLKTSSVPRTPHNHILTFNHLSCEPLKPEMLLYNRIFKTGSTTLETVLRHDGKKTGVHVQAGSTEDWYDVGKSYPYPGLITKYARKHRKEKNKAVFSSHFYFRANLNIKQKFTYINQVRDPVSRVVSHYYYMRSEDRPKKRIIEFKKSKHFNESLYTCVEHEHDKGCQSNIMTHFFCGARAFCKNGSKEALETAKDNILRYYAVVGVLEQIDIFLDVLHKMLPEFFIEKNELLKVKRKVNQNKNYLMDKIDERTLDLIREKNWADVELYKFVVDLFWKRVTKCGL